MKNPRHHTSHKHHAALSPLHLSQNLHIRVCLFYHSEGFCITFFLLGLTCLGAMELRVLVVLVLMAVLRKCEGRCNYPAIFNFGDSTSDTGAIHFVFPNNMLAEHPPYGRTYFGKPVNRYSDGRLSIDFLASALGLPFLSPYLQSVGSNYAHGANFAAAGATARDVSFIAPINLAVQVNQFRVFKQQVLSTIAARGAVSYLPTADAFGKALYVIEIGGNDFSYGYMNLKMGPNQVRQTLLPEAARKVAAAVRDLYNEGARTILVRDVGPQGCEPFWLSYFSHSAGDIDQMGCSVSYNDAVKYYNALLKIQVASLQGQLRDANVIYVNTYKIIFDFIANPRKYGFKQTTRACCGIGGTHNYMYSVQCGVSGTVNGKQVTAGSCPDPDSYVNWDGVHWTDRANRLLTQRILSGRYFEPSFSLSQHCDLRPI